MKRYPLLRATLALVTALVLAGRADAEPMAVPSGLAPLGQELRLPNPYRGDVSVHEAGERSYERHCAECHGERSLRPVAEGPDLRRLNSFCRRLDDAVLHKRCLHDVDTYFMRSVLEGKLRAGQMHMPAWKGVLAQETIWAIRSYTETRPLPPPRTLPDLPPGGAVSGSATAP